MKIKEATYTFGVSSHFFKSSISMTVSEEDGSFSYGELKREILRRYYKLLFTELRLTERFDSSESIEDISKFVKKQIVQTRQQE